MTPQQSPLVSARFALLAACMMHMEGYYSTNSKAFRDRNPGNIEVPGGNGTMRTYPDALSGFEALVVDIAVNAGRPLSKFIAKYAPPNENDTSLYLEVVSTLSGIGKDEIL